MPKAENRASGFLVQIWGRLKGVVVAEVPADCAICEFDCCQNQCAHGEWATCMRRLSHGAGELMPNKRASHASC